ncbi:conserved hypothetical protein [Desulfarculus baarsii DSM 2075]|uniref:DUF4872 domain-containing protein n=1 Tax=Desulfarculus baarsii (strain ATCC 33931 / DSM 2075 / LMG 7858 / VKM B-1802 / 2st14) TaxID=644282 RepID=E1QHD9_DESB2|nr:BtrH N-terminal domain-containing protein [Desulfarculus baarsii]ADK84982.1 conserved hypothetical protein [Desulfarculus baarsii DSM 2075]
MVLLPVTHQPGRHCASSGARDLACFHGLELSEAMCFGLGAGLGLWLMEAASPSRLIHLRSHDMEAQFFRRIGQDFRWTRFVDGPASHQGLIAALDDGRPALLRSDIYHLPYYNTKTHFPGHVIVAWGYDQAAEEFLLSDTERSELQRTPFAAVQLARFSTDGYFKMNGDMYAPAALTDPGPLAPAVAQAIVFCSRRLLEGHGGHGGLTDMARWLAQMPAWGELPDWRWTTRFCYQMIERRGTGGGGFRLMYADFLDEAAELLPEVGRLKLPALMRALAADWTALAMALKDASERDAPDFGRATEALAAVARAEVQYHRQAVLLA